MATYRTTARYAVSDNGTTANRKPRETVSYYMYTSRQGDTFDLLAYRFFNDPERYWEIADINPHVEWPDQIPVGTSIRIPQT